MNEELFLKLQQHLLDNISDPTKLSTANKQVTIRLEKGNIPLSDFVNYSILKECPPTQ